MKNSLLISNKYKAYGWTILLAFTALHVFSNIIFPDLTNRINSDGVPWAHFWASLDDSSLTFNGAGILLGLIIICFSKEKNEDEYISYLRLRSWQWSVLISYGILFLANLLIYGGWFMTFMIYNMLTVLIVFIITFNLSLYKLKGARLDDEK